MKTKNETTMDQLVQSISYQANLIFNLYREDLENYSQCLRDALENTYENYHIKGVSGWVYRQKDNTCYDFAFEVSPFSNRGRAADALVDFALDFTENEAIIKDIRSITPELIAISFIL